MSFIILAYGKKLFGLQGLFIAIPRAATRGNALHCVHGPLGSVILRLSSEPIWVYTAAVSPEGQTCQSVNTHTAHSNLHLITQHWVFPLYSLAASLVTYKSWVGGKRQLLLWALHSECEIISVFAALFATWTRSSSKSPWQRVCTVKLHNSEQTSLNCRLQKIHWTCSDKLDSSLRIVKLGWKMAQRRINSMTVAD